MHTLYLMLLIVGASAFTLAAVNIGHSHLNLVALGLLAWILVPLIQTART